MSAPLLWIIFPGAFSAILFFLRRWRRISDGLGILVALLLAWLAWQVPIGEPLRFSPIPGSSSLTIADTLFVLGRRFVLEDSARPVLVLIYLAAAFWFGGAAPAGANRLFIPLGMVMASLLTAALAVEPFLYAALLIEMAALASIPILSPPGQPVTGGVLRFLTFQTFGMPFILFAGWMLGDAQSTGSSPFLLTRAVVVIVFGFAFLTAVFPFHSWIPMLGEETHPYVAAFVFFLLPGGVALFGMEFLSRYRELSAMPTIYQVLQFLGLLMVAAGGLWAAFQRHLGRLLGYAASVEIGLSILALSLPAGTAAGDPARTWIFFALFIPRALGLALWALAATTLQTASGGLRFQDIRGYARRMPMASAALLAAVFSLGGLPVLAGFPVRLALWTALVEQSLPAALLTLLGTAGLLVGAVRIFFVLAVDPDQTPWQVSETRTQTALLAAGTIVLVLMGMLPQWFLPSLENIANLASQR